MTDTIVTAEDDLFWLQRAGAIVNGTADKLDNGAKRLADAMAWFWTAYSAVALVTTTRTKIGDNTAAAVALAVPSVLIFAAYLVASLATLPIEVAFDDRIPSEIKAAHDHAIQRRRRRIKVSTTLATFAAVAVAVAVVAAASIGEDASSPDAVAIRLSSDQSHVLAGGNLKDVESVVLRITEPAGASTELVVPIHDGEFHTSVPLTKAGTYEVAVSWILKNLVYTVTDHLERP